MTVRVGWVDLPRTPLAGWALHAWQWTGRDSWASPDRPAWTSFTATGAPIEPELGTSAIPFGAWLVRRIGDPHTYAVLADADFRCLWREPVL